MVNPVGQFIDQMRDQKVSPCHTIVSHLLMSPKHASENSESPKTLAREEGFQTGQAGPYPLLFKGPPLDLERIMPLVPCVGTDARSESMKSCI